MSDDLAEKLIQRLAERDAVEDGDWRKEKAPSREQQDHEKEVDATTRRLALHEAYTRALDQAEEKSVDEPQAPPPLGPNATLRDEIRHALKWHSDPPGKRRAMARNAAEIEKARKLGEELGLEVRTPADVAAVLRQAGAGGQDGAPVPAALMQEVEALAPYRERAEAQGSTLPEALQRYTAAEDFLARDPHGALRWLCAGHNVAPAELDPALSPYTQVAQGAGMSLPGMVERYLAAEMLLDRDPAAALRFLCRHYGIDPRSLA